MVELLVGLLRELHTPAAALHALRREIDATGARLTDDLTLALALLAGDTLQASRRELSRGLDDLGTSAKIIRVPNHPWITGRGRTGRGSHREWRRRERATRGPVRRRPGRNYPEIDPFG